MSKALDHPVVAYFIVSACSLGVALLSFSIGGSLAEVTGNTQSLAGVTFKASGGIGGFVLVFLLSLHALTRLRGMGEETSPLRAKVHLIGKPERFTQGNAYQCRAVIFNAETGDRREQDVVPRWEAGYLTLDFLGLTAHDYIGATIRNGSQQTWYLQDFQPLISVRETLLQ